MSAVLGPLRRLLWLHVEELCGGDNAQADAAGHLVGHVAAPLPQPEPLGLGGVLDGARQDHLAQELILHRVAVPHLHGGRRRTNTTQRRQLGGGGVVKGIRGRGHIHSEGFKRAASSFLGGFGLRLSVSNLLWMIH